MFGAGSIERSVRGVLTVLFLSFSVPVRAELLLWYSFDDDSDPLLAVDKSGQGNDGVISGNDLDGDGIPDTPAVYTDPGLGRTLTANDRALDFLTTAEGTYITVPNAAVGAFDSMTANDAATVAMWIFGSDAQPVNQWNFWFGPNRQISSHCPWSDGTIYFDVAGCCGANQRLQQNEPDTTKWKGEWNHYAFVKEQDATRIYQNGVLWAESAGGMSPLGAITEVFFGAGDSNHSNNYNGLMDEIGVWDEALSEVDIQNVMENGVGPPRPISMKRDIPDTLINGTTGVVTISVVPKVPGGGVVVINEKMPPGLTASSPSNNGALAGDTITWNLGKVDTQINVTYTMAAALDAMDGKLPSTATVDGAAAGIGGDTSYKGSFYTALGFLRLWNHLGPLAFTIPAVAGDHGPPGACDANGGVDLAKDWIVNQDGSVTELNVKPFPGRIIRPAYGGDGAGLGARAAGLVIEAGDTGAVVTNRFPAWKGGLSRGDTVDHASAAVHGFDADDHVTLSSVYVTNKTGSAIDTNLGIGSDDSIQIFLNDADLTAGGIAICRGWGAANEEQDIVPVTLPPGESRLLVKVADGGGPSGFRLRFQNPADPLGPGLLPPAISLSLESATSPPPVKAVRDIAQATYNLRDKVDVSIAVTATVATNVRVREVLPDSASAEAISDGGVLAGGVVQWDLTGVTAKTVTYKLLPALCAGAFTFGQSTWQAGSVEALVTGESSVSRNPFADQPLGAWQSVDIGYTGGAAQALGEHDVVVDAGGAGVKGKEDQLRFIYISMKGDFELSAQIDCMDDSGALGQAGLMVRDTTDVFSAHALFALSTVDFRKTGIRIFKGAYRRATDPTRSSTLSTITNNREVASLPIWVKLQRAGTKISFFRSSDGINYGDPISERDIGTGNTQVDLKEDALVGLAATGGGGRADVTFRSVSGPSFAGGGTSPSFHRGDSDDNGSLQLTDAVRILNFLFLGTGKITCMDAADVDNNGTVQLTDAVRVLNVLFLGTGSIPDPGPPGESFGNKPCGPDPGDTHIGCETYTHC